MRDYLGFQGQTVLVTGAGHGLGRAIAHEFAARGAAIWAADINEASLAETAATAPAAITIRPADVTDRAQVQDFAAAAHGATGRIVTISSGVGLGISLTGIQAYAAAKAAQIGLTRQLADAIGWSAEPYDALISLPEPGETAASLRTLFGQIRAGLAPLLNAIAASPAPQSGFLEADYPPDRQHAFALSLARQISYDFKRGRLDPTVHPFVISFTRDDVRITTRYPRNYLPASLFGTLHETGHALYEQGVDSAYSRGPLATDFGNLYAVGGVSFGAHESQSRLWENHVGRSSTFWALHYGALRDHFPEQLAGVDEEAFHRAVNRVRPGLIRVEADELTYDFHIMLRVEIEGQLIDGTLKVKDLPQAWNAAIKRDLDLDVPDDARGVLQDIHWSAGYIGTFCTYTIGNIMAAQLMAAARRQMPMLDATLSRGDYTTLQNWLGDNIHRHGRRFTRDELLTQGNRQRAGGRTLYRLSE